MGTFTQADLSDPNLDVNTFAPTDLDIDQWLDACVSAGMTYATLTTKHHDGFALWPTAYHVGANPPYSVAQTTWYANNGNPDIVSLFVTKCRAHNLNPCLYFSMLDLTYEVRSGTNETTDAAGYLVMIEAQLTELLTNYGDITALWFDGWGWHMGYEEIPYATVYNFVKNLQPNCLVIENSHTHPTVTSEIEVYEFGSDGHIPEANVRRSEEVDTMRVDNAWFYVSADSDAALTSAAELLEAIHDANNYTGTYQLGIAPGTDGHLSAAQVTRLGEIGA